MSDDVSADAPNSRERCADDGRGRRGCGRRPEAVTIRRTDDAGGRNARGPPGHHEAQPPGAGVRLNA
eukprot:93015-Prorocentrum_minimum.AAC.2